MFSSNVWHSDMPVMAYICLQLCERMCVHFISVFFGSSEPSEP